MAIEDTATFARKPGSGTKNHCGTGTCARVTAFLTEFRHRRPSTFYKIRARLGSARDPRNSWPLEERNQRSFVHTPEARPFTPVLTRISRTEE
jgi:hypothetical protein